MWSVPHFFFGVVVASSVGVFGLPVGPALVGMLALALMWEFFEIHVGIRETCANRVADGLLPLLGFVLMYQVFQTAPLADEHAPLVLFVALFVFALVNYVSWGARLSGESDFQG